MQLVDLIPGSADDTSLHIVHRVSTNDANDAIRNPALGVTYDEINLPNKRFINETVNGVRGGLMKLCNVTKDSDGMLAFRFAPIPSTSSELQTPFLTYRVLRPYGWPPVLGRPDFLIDERNPRVGEKDGDPVYLPRGMVRFKGDRAAMHCFTAVDVRLFVSGTRWNPNLIYTTEPQPRPVEFEWYGWRQPSLNCLHPTFSVPAQNRLNRDTAGNTLPAFAMQEIRFKRTNYETWGDWTISNQERTGDGLWLRTEETYISPDES